MHTMTRVYNPARERFEWRLFQAFADGYQGFVPVGGISSGTGGIKLHNGDEAWGYLGGGRDGFFDHAYYPQNPERPLTKQEIEAIRGEVAAMLNKDKCKSFINSLLAAAAKETRGTYSADVLANFDAVAKEGGFHARYERVGTMPNGAPIYAGGDQNSPPVGSGKARVDFNPNNIATMNQFNNIIYVALTALHEVLHASGERFDDSTFAIAVAKMNGLESPKRASNMQEILERSGEWDKALKDACLTWRSPVAGGKK
jgi:hypothetical protein